MMRCDREASMLSTRTEGDQGLQERIDRHLDHLRGFKRKTLRRRIYEIIEVGHGEDLASKIFDAFIVTLILLNVAAFVAETVPTLRAA